MSDPLTIGPTSGPSRNSSARPAEGVGAVDSAREARANPISRGQNVAAMMRLAADLAALPPIDNDPTPAASRQRV